MNKLEKKKFVYFQANFLVAMSEPRSVCPVNITELFEKKEDADEWLKQKQVHAAEMKFDNLNKYFIKAEVKPIVIEYYPSKGGI